MHKLIVFSFLAASFLPSAVFGQKGGSALGFDVRDLPDFAGSAALRESPETLERRAAGIQARLASLQAETGAPLVHTTSRFGALRTLSARGAFLTPADAGAPADLARAYLSRNAALFGLTEAEVEKMVLGQRPSGAVRMVTLTQQANGVRVFRGDIRVAVDSAGKILQVEGGDVLSGLRVTGEAKLTPAEAVTRAFALSGAKPTEAVEPAASSSDRWRLFTNPVNPALTPAALEATVFPLGDGQGRMAYRVLTYTARGGFDVILSADSGALLYRAPLTSSARARVWKTTPLAGPRESEELPAEWLAPGAMTTSGAYVDAFLDRDGDDAPDDITSGSLRDGRAFSETADFDFPSGSGFANVEEFPASAVSNAFYHANRAHDYFFELGFRGVDGAFQQEDAVPVGRTGDPVQVNVHDGEERLFQNASFTPTPDGVPGVMNLGVFLLPDGSERDPALSGPLIFHEYTHGVIQRLVGGPSDIGCLGSTQGRSLSEGWSDYFGASAFDNPVVGGYLANDETRGVRRFPLDANPLTYADLLDPLNLAHNNGEIFAAALWDLRQALGAETVDRMVLESLRLTPCAGHFITARDALLAADRALNRGVNRDEIWRVFAARGMGFSASADEDFSGGGHLTLFNSTVDLPPESGGDNLPPIISSRPAEFAMLDESVVYLLRIRDPEGDAFTVEMTDGPEGAQFDATLNRLTWKASFSGARFEFTVTDARGAATVHGFFWLSFAILDNGNQVVINGPESSRGLAFWLFRSNAPAAQVTLRGGTGDADLTVFTPLDVFDSETPGSDETLTIADPPQGVYFIEVNGFDAYSGVTLAANGVRPAPLLLGSSTIAFNGARTSERILQIDVPAGTSTLRVQSHGGQGDADLLIAHERVPTCPFFANTPCDFDNESDNLGPYEAIEIDNPAAGEWFVALHGARAFQGVTLEASSSAASVRPSAATEAAAFEPVLAQKGISTLFGEGFSDVVAEADSLPLPTELGGVKLFVSGEPAGLFFVRNDQVNFQNPLGEGSILGSIVAVRDGEVSESVSALVAPDVPRLFSFAQGGQALPVVIHLDGSVVTAANPAKPGETLIAFLTGLSSVSNLPRNGEPALASPLSESLLETIVEVGGVVVETLFSGWTPNLVALVQVNFTLDAATPTGTQSFQIRFGTLSTQELVLPVAP